MKSLVRTKLLESIKADPVAREEYEKIQIISTGLSRELSMEDLLKRLKNYQDQGYHSIKFTASDKNTQSIQLQKNLTLDEMFQYRVDSVHNRVLRWLQDGKVRFTKILKEKDLSVELYTKKIQKLKDRNVPIQQAMINLLEKKSARANYYRTRIQEMEQVINNYPDYTYEELKGMRDHFFKEIGGYLK